MKRIRWQLRAGHCFRLLLACDELAKTRAKTEEVREWGCVDETTATAVSRYLISISVDWQCRKSCLAFEVPIEIQRRHNLVSAL